MKRTASILIAMAALCGGLAAQPSAFNGSYTGQHQGAAAQASLQTHNGQVRGSFDYNGTHYSISGLANGQSASGKALAAEEEWAFEASETAGRLDITFSNWGGLLSIPFVLQKQESTTTISKMPPQQTATPAKGALDGRLVGAWVKSSMINSGSGSNFASFTTETLMLFNADGTFEYGASRSVGGGGSWSYDGGGWSAPQLSGTYSSDGSRIFILTANGQSIPREQQLMGSYYIDGNAMSTTPLNGTKEYWERR